MRVSDVCLSDHVQRGIVAFAKFKDFCDICARAEDLQYIYMYIYKYINLRKQTTLRNQTTTQNRTIFETKKPCRQ